MPNESQPISPNSANPYAGEAAGAAYAIDPHVRPGGLTVIGVLCIVGGIVGLLSGLFGMVSVFFGSAMASAFVPAGPQQQIQLEMNAAIQDVTSKYMIPNVAILFSSIGICGCLLVGGIGGFGKPARGRSLLLKVMLIAMIVECLRIAIYVVTQLEMLPIMETFMPRMMNPNGNNPASAPTFGKMMRVMTLIGLGLWVGWGLIKLGLLAWGRSYLKKPHVVDYYKTPLR